MDWSKDWWTDYLMDYSAADLTGLTSRLGILGLFGASRGALEAGDSDRNRRRSRTLRIEHSVLWLHLSFLTHIIDIHGLAIH